MVKFYNQFWFASTCMVQCRSWLTRGLDRRSCKVVLKVTWPDRAVPHGTGWKDSLPFCGVCALTAQMYSGEKMSPVLKLNWLTRAMCWNKNWLMAWRHMNLRKKWFSFLTSFRCLSKFLSDDRHSSLFSRFLFLAFFVTQKVSQLGAFLVMRTLAVR